MNHRFGLLPLLAWLAQGCVVTSTLPDQVARTQDTISAAHRVYAPLCAPRDLAEAQSNLDFSKIELSQGYPRRAAEHLVVAYDHAVKALEISTPCGGVDTDKDTIADIVDRCPKEPEDFDGDNDEDGCRDIDKYGDEDGDGIVNIEDGCVDQPEDFDGDNDEDGCPETSEDSDGDGLINAVDSCPTEAEDLDGFKDSDGCPEYDNDSDGVVDLNDACPLVPEDQDLWEDEDGCPDPDNDLDGIPDVNDQCPNQPGDRDHNGCPLEDADKDGVADAVDRCPNEPETVNQYLDEDGCPDEAQSGLRVTNTQIEIEETIQFQTGQAELLPASFPILDKVVKVMKDAPYLRLRIEGHTDSEGSDESNMTLSRERAFAVRRYVESRGIAADRLESQGFGETRPIDTNRTPSGRARNRRVEFHIVKPE
ncbi:MAG: OmpA family protein [Alphaproteobacteria bacterium]|nr:OmpA family protein [Alphaproteobacteria bacterium]